MQATLFWACTVAPKRLRRFAHAQNDLIWTAAGATELDLAAAPNGGSSRVCHRIADHAPRSVRADTDASAAAGDREDGYLAFVTRYLGPQRQCATSLNTAAAGG